MYTVNQLLYFLTLHYTSYNKKQLRFWTKQPFLNLIIKSNESESHQFFDASEEKIYLRADAHQRPRNAITMNHHVAKICCKMHNNMSAIEVDIIFVNTCSTQNILFKFWNSCFFSSSFCLILARSLLNLSYMSWTALQERNKAAVN